MNPTGATKEFVNAGGRPWKLYTKFSTLREPFQIQDADGSTVAIVTYDPMTMEPEDADDNAALIVRAVNERERLREALRQVRAASNHRSLEMVGSLVIGLIPLIDAALNDDAGMRR